MPQQIDTDFKVRYERLGGHIHLTLFSKPRVQSTWQNCGDLVIGAESFADFQIAMPNVSFEKKS